MFFYIHQRSRLTLKFSLLEVVQKGVVLPNGDARLEKNNKNSIKSIYKQ
jgi:hypothetical protein